jgi:hypothetical protein
MLVEEIKEGECKCDRNREKFHPVWMRSSDKS